MKETNSEYNWKGGATHGVIAPFLGYGFSKGLEHFGFNPDPVRDFVLMSAMTFGFGTTYALISEVRIFVRNLIQNGLKR